MANPQRKFDYNNGIQPDIRPDLRVIKGGGETDDSRADLKPVDSPEDLSKREETAAGGSNVTKGPWGEPEANTASAREQEEHPDDYNGFYNPSGKKRDKKIYFSWKNLKKKSSLFAIILTLLGFGGGIAVVTSPSLLLFHVAENLILKYDSQNTSMSIRLNKLIANKISKDATTGSCNHIKIACRFARPSNTLLKNLEKNGIVAVDKSGHPITKTGPFQATRPAQYEFTDSVTGKKIGPIAATDFSKVLQDNPDFRAAFHRAYNPRFVGYSDSVFKMIEERFDINKQDQLKDTKTVKDAETKIEDTALGGDTEAKIAASEGETASETLLKKLLKGQATKAVTTLRNSSKGGGLQMAAGAACLAADTPKLITGVVRAYQMAQLIRFGMVFMSSVQAIQAGDGKPNEAAALGDLLTTVVAGKSAMDSFGMKYTLFGDTKSSDKTFSRFVPGGSVVSAFSGISTITNDPATKEACSIATNPITGAALNGVLVANSGDTLGASLAAAGLNLAAGWAVGQIIEKLTPVAIDAAMSLFGTQVQQMMATLLGDLTKNVIGQPAGNVVTAGPALLMGQTANGAANVAMTVPETMAYEQVTQQVQLAYAQEDRATLSPLDPTSNNTFIGGIVNQLLPYYADLGSASGILSTIGSITSSSIGSLFQTNAAGNPDQYKLCNDPTIKNSNIAAGPFCNIIYGIPPQYLDMDPQTVLDNLISSHDVDDQTGEPVPGSGLADFISLCTDGTTDNLDSCKIDPSTQSADDAQKIAQYAVYTIDHRIQKTMDGEDNS